MELITTFIDIVLHLDKYLQVLIQDYGVWIYAILFLIIFCETGLVVAPFLPGDSLGLDLTSFQRYDTSATAEVHGNQYGMLASSKCFIKSEMTCSTCHRPHAAERGSAAAFCRKRTTLSKLS